MALSDANVDDTMADDWKAIQEKYAVEEEPAPHVEETETPETGAETQDSVSRTETARNKDGTFAKTTKETPDGSSKPAKTERSDKVPAEAAAKGPAAARTDGAENAGAVDSGRVPGADSRVDVNRAPSSWKATERAAWDKVPPEARAAIHRRESEMAAGAQQLVPDAQFGRSIKSAVEPYRMLIEAEGGTPERAIGDLLKTAAIFRVGTNEQKARAVAGIVQQFGIDMRVLMPQGQQMPGQVPPQQQFHDPRVDQLLAQQQRERQESSQREQQSMAATVTQWMNEADANGNPVRPYLSDVINDMLPMIPSIKAANPALTNAQALEEAYQRATWANPEVRTVLQREAAAATSSQTQADNQTRAREARRAASVNVPRRASIPAQAKPGAMEDTIAATARELGLIT